MSMSQTVVLMGAMFAAKGIDWEVDGRLDLLRIVWVAVQAAALLVVALVYRAIAARRGSPDAKRVLRVPRTPSFAEPQVGVSSVCACAVRCGVFVVVRM